MLLQVVVPAATLEHVFVHARVVSICGPASDNVTPGCWSAGWKVILS